MNPNESWDFFLLKIKIHLTGINKNKASQCLIKLNLLMVKKTWKQKLQYKE